jgi:GTP-binding protein
LQPTFVIVGRPNVGKSTLFNRLTRTRDALVAELPGLTRDRHYGRGRFGERSFLVVDTGGLEPGKEEGILAAMAKQTQLAIAEADVILFLLDARDGLTTQDREIAARLRGARAPVVVVVNKAEGLDAAISSAEFHELGLGAPHAISSAHGQGVSALLQSLLAGFPLPGGEAHGRAEEEDKHPRIAIIGRPNVGKSTLFNRLLGEERSIVFDQPGTTRDAIEVTLERSAKTGSARPSPIDEPKTGSARPSPSDEPKTGSARPSPSDEPKTGAAHSSSTGEPRRYTFIDTAGVRRRGNIQETIEKFSVIKSMQSVERANVVLLVLDANEIAEQDARLAGFVLEEGRAVVLAVNKWDAVHASDRERVKSELARKMGFLSFSRTHFISARNGTGVDALLPSIDRAYAAATAKLSTPKLTRTLIAAVQKQQPPRRGAFRPKLRYAHQGGSNPPLVVIHGSALNEIPDSYRRYLEKTFRETFDLQGTPLRIQFRQGNNPYDRG